MKRIATLIAAACLITACWSSTALAWGSAAHAYIDDRIGRPGMAMNFQELYGSMAPDVFNFSFSRPQMMAYLYRETHTSATGIWDAAQTPAGKALGYGFASHNGIWGADLTAHSDGRISGQGTGYVIAKARLLVDIMKQVPEIQNLRLPDDVLLEVCHSMVEYGVDILVKRLDPQIGRKVAAAALFRSPEFPALLNRTYVDGLAAAFGISRLEATDFIIGTESNFRHMTLQYGIELTRDETDLVPVLAGQLSSVAASFLKVYGIELPAGTDLTPLAASGIAQAMGLCAGDYAAELAATRKFTRKQLTLHGITD